MFWSTTLNMTHNSREIVFSLYYVKRQRIICYDNVSIFSMNSMLKKLIPYIGMAGDTSPPF